VLTKSAEEYVSFDSVVEILLIIVHNGCLTPGVHRLVRIICGKQTKSWSSLP